MAVLYSSAEIAAIGRAGAVCARILSEAAGAARAGVSGLEIDALARRRLSEAGAESVLAEQVGPSGTFRGAISVSTGRTVANGTPAARAFAPGELVRLDLAVRLDGWVCDAATTVAAGEPSPEAQRVLAGAQVALDATIASMSPGVRWSEAVRAGRAAAAAAGVHVADWPWGHGVGRRLHEPPVLAADCASPAADFELRRGMVLAVEPIVLGAPAPLAGGRDGWSIVAPCGRAPVAACEERTVAIVEAAVEILTRLR